MQVKHAIRMVGWHRQTRNKCRENIAVEFDFVCCTDSFTELHDKAYAFAKQVYPRMTFVWNGYITQADMKGN